MDLRIIETGKNKILIEQLSRLAKYKEHVMNCENDTNKRRTLGFSHKCVIKVLKGIESCKVEIKTSEEAQDLVDGIGKGMKTKIDEILRTGKLSEIPEELPKSLIDELCKIPGIGPVTGKRIIEKYEIESLEELYKMYKRGDVKEGKNELSHSMCVGLKHYYDLKERIPRSEMKKLVKVIKEGIPDGITSRICGSYRRGSESSGDIDVLITSEENRLKEVVKKLEKKGFLIDHFAKGQKKYMGVCKLREGYRARHIDILYINRSYWAAASLFFTGSAGLNIKMRNIAISKGYKLNEVGLYEGERLIETKREREIFEHLGLKYLKPSEREI